jgi:hypothetical protein
MACDHLLWPLQDGAIWQYRLTDPTGSTELTLRADTQPGGMMLALADRTSSLNCVDGALVGLLPGLLGSGHPTLGGDVMGTNTRGSLLPPLADLLPLGTPTAWDMEIDLSGSIWLPLGGSLAPTPIMAGRQVLFHESGELSPLTVAAGSYLALPVQQDIFYEIEVLDTGGNPIPVLISTTTQLYYVEGLGLVKAVYQGGTISAPSDAWPLEPGPVLELVSIAQP